MLQWPASHHCLLSSASHHHVISRAFLLFIGGEWNDYTSHVHLSVTLTERGKYFFYFFLLAWWEEVHIPEIRLYCHQFSFFNCTLNMWIWIKKIHKFYVKYFFFLFLSYMGHCHSLKSQNSLVAYIHIELCLKITGLGKVIYLFFMGGPPNPICRLCKRGLQWPLSQGLADSFQLYPELINCPAFTQLHKSEFYRICWWLTTLSLPEALCVKMHDTCSMSNTVNCCR